MSEKYRQLNDEFALGYRVQNPDAPLSERRFVAINPQLQAKAEEIFWKMHNESFQSDE